MTSRRRKEAQVRSMRAVTGDRPATHRCVVTDSFGCRFHDAGAMTSRPAPAVYEKPEAA
jgi:hypothetical protein